jgi:hypothetical protein
VRLEGLGQLKNPMTSSRIKPATFRLVLNIAVLWTVGSGVASSIPPCTCYRSRLSSEYLFSSSNRFTTLLYGARSQHISPPPIPLLSHYFVSVIIIFFANGTMNYLFISFRLDRRSFMMTRIGMRPVIHLTDKRVNYNYCLNFSITWDHRAQELYVRKYLLDPCASCYKAHFDQFARMYVLAQFVSPFG